MLAIAYKRASVADNGGVTPQNFQKALLELKQEAEQQKCSDELDQLLNHRLQVGLDNCLWYLPGYQQETATHRDFFAATAKNDAASLEAASRLMAKLNWPR
ncbi:MAG: hypothetical protein WC748_05995 [Legionellales bacterium]